ncbi:alpha beta-hydrolase [Fusarium tjaetaba]|uniref:Alpha beta-hydrolase n=1 Tax=Fusarium tjaetaba TaxID=1567544 RepID=A0A8H5VH96_9HYPO|nr:alpha beta-hydrolase [Fusarium tjaetaba]KAF5624662.1 alpha beta-hydrolase [Fusarium tjaetaba]
MVSLIARLFRFYLVWIRRSKTQFLAARNMREHIKTQYIYPQSFSPPKNLGPNISIERVDVNDWPLYRISSSPFSPKVGDEANRPAMLYCHGGGWVNEIVTQHYNLVAQIARDTGLDVLVPIYPLIPRPAATAVQVIAGLHEIMNRVKQPIVSIGGDSAGGNLAMLLAQHLVRVDSDLRSRVRSLILISPALDCTLSHPETKILGLNDPWLSHEGLHVVADVWAGGLARSDPRVSPLFGDIVDLPPILLLSGTHDLLCADARRLSARFRNGGTSKDMDTWAVGSVELERFKYVEVEEMVHVWPLTPSPEGAEARKIIMEFIRKYL